jgi:hypothetical protein
MGGGTVHGARREHSSVAKGWQRELVALSFITMVSVPGGADCL